MESVSTSRALDLWQRLVITHSKQRNKEDMKIGSQGHLPEILLGFASWAKKRLAFHTVRSTIRPKKDEHSQRSLGNQTSAPKRRPQVASQNGEWLLYFQSLILSL